MWTMVSLSVKYLVCTRLTESHYRHRYSPSRHSLNKYYQTQRSSWSPFKRDVRDGGGRGKCSLMDGADRLLRNAPPGPTVTHQCQCRSPVWGLKLRRALCQKIYNFDGGASVIVQKLRRTIKNSQCVFVLSRWMVEWCCTTGGEGGRQSHFP